MTWISRLGPSGTNNLQGMTSHLNLVGPGKLQKDETVHDHFVRSSSITNRKTEKVPAIIVIFNMQMEGVPGSRLRNPRNFYMTVIRRVATLVLHHTNNR
jgi:hypothetical protein